MVLEFSFQSLRVLEQTHPHATPSWLIFHDQIYICMRSAPHTDQSGSRLQLQVFVSIIMFVISWSTHHHLQQISHLIDGCVFGYIPSDVHPHPLFDSLSVSLCSRPPYYAAGGGHRHQWGPNRSPGRLERGAHKSAVASLSVLYVVGPSSSTLLY